MCGINIILDPTHALTEEPIKRMMEATRHRGPDEQKVVKRVRKEFTLWAGTNRLVIEGGGEGRQPLEAGEAFLCYNGEIYGESEAADACALFDRLVKGTAKDANGMYAYAWFDGKNLTVGRDPYGIKPLFKGEAKKGVVLYSSEIEGLLASGLLPDTDVKVTNRRKVTEWLTYRYVLGESLVSQASPVDITYPLPNQQKAISKPIEWEPLFKAVVTRQRYQGGSSGIMLSGGLDSSVLLALMAEVKGPQLFAYTLNGPEAEVAQRHSAKFGIECKVVPAGNGEDLDVWLHHQRWQPVADSAGYLTWLLARQARADGIKVLYSGAGADELFMGYRRHQAWRWLLRLSKTGLSPLLSFFDDRLGRAASLMQKTRMAAFAYLTTQPALRHLNNDSGVETISNKPGNEATPFNIRGYEIEHFLREDVLAITDLATMAHGVECRVPYLDNEVVAMAMASNPYAAEMWNKAPLRTLYKHYYGTSYKGKKRGFGLYTFTDMPDSQIFARCQLPTHPVFQYVDYVRYQSLLKKPSFWHEKYSVLALGAWAEAV